MRTEHLSRCGVSFKADYGWRLGWGGQSMTQNEYVNLNQWSGMRGCSATIRLKESTHITVCDRIGGAAENHIK